jgi:plasmid replication initiation protein
MLSEAVMTLFNRQVTYMTIDEKRNKPEKRVVRWVSGISYVEGAGVVKLRFAPEIVPLITRLEQNFTSYELMQVANLNLYATRLYELLVSWRSAGKTPIFEINEFRSKIGLIDNEYKAMCDFKKRVLDPAIKQINEHTDIAAAFEQHKTGRVISGFSFKFKQKKQTAEKPAPIKQVKEQKDNLVWGTSENHLLKELSKKCVGLSKEYVEQLARKHKQDLSFVLNDMFMKQAKSDSFELELTD